MLILKYISMMSVIMPFAFALMWKVDRHGYKVRALIVFMLVAQAADSILFFSESELRNSFYHIYTVLEYSVFSFLFFTWENEHEQRTGLIIILGFAAIMICELVESGIDKSGMFIESIVLFLLSAILFLKISSYHFSFFLTSDMRFWFSLSCLIYFGINTISFPLINHRFMQSVHAVNNILFSLLITTGFVCRQLHSMHYRLP